MKLYHGSSVVVGKPVFGKGNPKNDYGLGFYCTPHAKLAAEWACVDGFGGFVNAYSLNTDGLSVLDLTGGDYTILHWLAVLLENRTFRLHGDLAPLAKEYLLNTFAVPYRECDVVQGYRADDSYFAFANAFLDGALSLPQLERAMALGDLGIQVVPRTQKAFDRLEVEGHCAVKAEEYYPRHMARDEAARMAFAENRYSEEALLEPRITDVLRERWGEHDARLQRIILA